MLGLALVPRAAWAGASFALSWRSEVGAPVCVTEAALRDAVEKKLRRKPFTDRDRADIVIEGDEVFTAGRFRARVTQRERSGAVLGSRELDASSCASLIRTTTIVVALFIESESAGEPEEDRPPSEEPVEGPAPEVERVPPENRALAPETRSRPLRPRPPASTSEASRRPFDLSLGFGGAAAVGLLPSPSASVRVVARLSRPGSRFSFEWSGGYSLPQTIRDELVRGTFSAVDQQLRACLAVVPGSKLSLDACGGLFWGAIVPSTTGVDAAGIKERSDAWRPLVAPTATVALRLGDGTRSVRFDLGLAAPPVRRAFHYATTDGEVERLYTTGQVIVFVGLSGLITIL